MLTFQSLGPPFLASMLTAEVFYWAFYKEVSGCVGLAVQLLKSFTVFFQLFCRPHQSPFYIGVCSFKKVSCLWRLAYHFTATSNLFKM